jgi:phage gp46-like protein
MSQCLVATAAQLPHFWTTQPDACGATIEADNCGGEGLCGAPGLSLVPVYSECNPLGCYSQIVGGVVTKPAPALIGASFATNDFIRSLALNILLTDATRKPSAACGVTIGRRGGYWADSFRTDGQYTGSYLRQLPAVGAMAQLAGLAQQYAQRDLQKLVAYGVATSVSVTATYLGGGTIALVCVINGDTGPATVNLNGKVSASAWAWSA